jgi:hypothetical protein
MVSLRSIMPRYFTPAELAATLAPVCLDLAARHARGEKIFVYASVIGADAGELPRLLVPEAASPPQDVGRDFNSMAPEIRFAGPSPRTSVYSIGAIAYEMLTLESPKENWQRIVPACTPARRPRRAGLSPSWLAGYGRTPRPDVLYCRTALCTTDPDLPWAERPIFATYANDRSR